MRIVENHRIVAIIVVPDLLLQVQGISRLHLVEVDVLADGEHLAALSVVVLDRLRGIAEFDGVSFLLRIVWSERMVLGHVIDLHQGIVVPGLSLREIANDTWRREVECPLTSEREFANQTTGIVWSEKNLPFVNQEDRVGNRNNTADEFRRDLVDSFDSAIQSFYCFSISLLINEIRVKNTIWLQEAMESLEDEVRVRGIEDIFKCLSIGISNILFW